MSKLFYEIPIQLAVIGAVLLVIYRDANGRRTRLGAAPGGVSPRTWAGLCGLLWVPALYYVAQRKRQDRGDVRPGAQIKHLWWILAVGLAAAWLTTDVIAAQAPGIVEHGLFLALVLAGWAWAATVGDPTPAPQLPSRR